MNSPLSELLQEIVPPIYADVAADQGRPSSANMAQSNQCRILTACLQAALQNRGLSARREYHQLRGNDSWHYLIAHHPEGTQPRPDDLVTDLNPWQFVPNFTNRQYLHGERAEIQEILRQNSAPEWFVSLRGIETITQMPGFHASRTQR